LHLEGGRGGGVLLLPWIEEKEGREGTGVRAKVAPGGGLFKGTRGRGRTKEGKREKKWSPFLKEGEGKKKGEGVAGRPHISPRKGRKKKKKRKGKRGRTKEKLLVGRNG